MEKRIRGHLSFGSDWRSLIYICDRLPGNIQIDHFLIYFVNDVDLSLANAVHHANVVVSSRCKVDLLCDSVS